MSYKSAHTGPEIDAAVQLLGQIQDARDSTRRDRIEVQDLAAQVKIDTDWVSFQTETVTAKASQVASSAAAVEQARSEVTAATAISEDAKAQAAASAASAQASQGAASSSEQAAAQSQLAAGLSEQVSAESAAEATSAAEQVAADRIATAASAASAATSAQNAEAVVSGGTASVTPGPGLIPLADAQGKINAQWIPDEIARSSAVEAATGVAAEAAEAAAESRSRTDSFLLPSPESPSLRDNGRPLQVGDRYFNTVDQAEYLYTFEGWAINDSLKAISEVHNNSDPQKGSSNVGFILDAEGAVGQNVHQVLSQKVRPSDFGLKGDGSDEGVALRRFLAAAAATGPSELGVRKTYGFTGPLTIPSNLCLKDNGSKFYRLDTGPNYGITIEDGVQIPNLRLRSIGGDAEGGINVKGSDCDFRTLVYISDQVDSGKSSNRNAILVSGVNNTRVAKGFVSNHTKPYSVQRVEDCDFGTLSSRNYVIGLYVIDAVSSTFIGGKHTQMSAMGVGGPGQNGVLIEATTDYGCRNLVFEGITVEDSPEHGFRMGGQFIMDSIRWSRLVSRRAGSGSAPTGGSSFKILGPNSRNLRHTNIQMDACISEDAGQTPGDNFNALDISYADFVHVTDFTSRKKDKPYASSGGIRLAQMADSTFTNPVVKDSINGSLRLVDVLGVTGTSLENITFTGGVFHRKDYSVILIEPKNAVYKNVTMTGVRIQGGGSAIRAEAPLAGGAYENVRFSFEYADPSYDLGAPSVAPAMIGSNDIVYDVTAPWYGTYGASGKDGSVFRDILSGAVRFRKGGRWIEQIEMASGIFKPTLSGFVNVDGTPSAMDASFSRVGSVCTVAGYIQAKPLAAGSLRIRMSLPVASNFTGFSQASGSSRTDSNDISGILQAIPPAADPATPGMVEFVLSATGIANRNIAYVVQYQIRP